MESVKASDKTIERKIENTVGARKQPYFMQFLTSNDFKRSPKMIDAFIPVSKADTSLTKRSGHSSFYRMFHSTSLFIESKAFVKLTNIM